ncbi:alpha/beta hydrolase [Mesorhizobium sp.]|uniref:alpha/beta fold hydrolase n=1 Tax=Mesorhizobium sp. TaxID=1871066 RepID=UPI00338FC166
MWRDIATAMAPRFTVVAADLRGYGQSGCPVSSADHSPYAKRAMAGDMVQVMKQLGFKQFMVAGHDRGGRVAWRSITPMKSPRSRSSTSSPPPPRGIGRTPDWLSPSGPGAFLRNRSLCRSD